MNATTAASLFAGIGGFELGLARAGIPTVASVEIDQGCLGVLADRFPDTRFPDVREVTGDQLTAVGFRGDGGVLTAGFPCQDLSVAGQRAGLSGSRSGLFWEVPRLAAETGAEWVVCENVPGLLSTHGGRDMGAVLRSLANLGYRLAWRVLDAQFFGVPQRRRRVFIVGRAGDRAGAEQILFEPEGGGGDPAPRRTPGTEIAGTLGSRVGGSRTTDLDGHGQGADDNRVIPALTTRCGSTQDDQQSMQLVPVRATGAPSLPLSFSENQRAEVLVSPIVRSMTVGGGKPGQGYPAVQTADAVRRLTPTECERLQGFPDGWTATSNGTEQSDSARYRQIGNAVAVPVVEWIARRLAGALDEEVAA